MWYNFFMSERRPDIITKSEDLRVEISNLMLLSGLNKSELSRRAATSDTTLGRILRLDDPRNVRKSVFVRIVNNLTDDPEQRLHLFELAGISLSGQMVKTGFIARISQEMLNLNLDPVRQHLLEEAVLPQVRLWGRVLREQQSQEEQELERNRVNKPSQKLKTA